MTTGVRFTVPKGVAFVRAVVDVPNNYRGFGFKLVNPGGRIKATVPSSQPAAVLIGNRIWTRVPKRILDNLTAIEASVLGTLKKHLPTYADYGVQTDSIFEMIRYGNIDAVVAVKALVTAGDVGLSSIENGTDVFNMVFAPLKAAQGVEITTKQLDPRKYVGGQILNALSIALQIMLDKAFPKKPRLVLDQHR